MKTKAQKHILKNGLRVILAPRPEALATNVMVLVEAGSKYETKEIGGLSHFLEHLCFKGTKKRPKPMDVSRDLDGLGASYNAFTSQEYTGYYATVAPKKTLEALELVADLYLNPILPPAEIEKEKGVIIEEMNMYEDMPQRDVQDLIMELMYQDQPAGWKIIGTKEIIRKMKREEILAYRTKHYVAEATTVVVAGNFAPAKVLKAIEKEFKSLRQAPKGEKLAVEEKQTKPASMVKTKQSDQTHFVIGLRGRPLGDKKEGVLAVLAGVLGGGMSSRLWRRVREELGAAYYVGASHDAYTDHGIFQIYAGADTKRIQEIIKVALVECEKLKKELVPVAELRRVKDAMTGRMFLGLESSSSLGQFYGFQELLEGKVREPSQFARAIEKVTASEVRELAREIFLQNQLNLAVIGPFAGKAPFVDVLRLK